MATHEHMDCRAVVVEGTGSCGTREYPAIDAVLKRKGAIKALQKKSSTNAAYQHKHVDSSHQQHLEHGLTEQETAATRLYAMLHQHMLKPTVCNAAGSCSSCGLAGVPDSDNLCNGSETPRTLKLEPGQQGHEQQLNVSGASQNSTCRTIEMAQDNKEPKTASHNVFATEFARVRQRHQQRTSAATVIQAAVRRWLARKHGRQQQLSLACLQQQQMQCFKDLPLDSRPARQQAAAAGSNASETAVWLPQTVRKWENPSPALHKSDPSTHLRGGTSSAASSLSDSSNSGPLIDNWQWQKLKRSVSLRCRQVLKQEGAYGMAAMYHRLRMEAVAWVVWSKFKG